MMLMLWVSHHPSHHSAHLQIMQYQHMHPSGLTSVPLVELHIAEPLTSQPCTVSGQSISLKCSQEARAELQV